VLVASVKIFRAFYGGSFLKTGYKEYYNRAEKNVNRKLKKTWVSLIDKDGKKWYNG
jgi:hypothetical protein